MAEVPATRTPITAPEAAAALIAQWPTVDRETAAMLLALQWMETGQGHQAVQHSPGNVTASESYESLWRPPWYPEPTAETSPKLRRLHELMLQHKAPRAFRAYPSWARGYDDWVGLLKVSYEPLLAAAATGEVSRFRAELAKKYSGDYTPAHDKGLTQFRDSFREHVSMQPAPEPAATTPQTPAKPGLDFSAGGLQKLAMLYLAFKGIS